MSEYELIFGTTPYVSLGITLVLGGGCALMTGRALALNWRPQWQLVAYAVLLGVADRFLIYALFQGALFSVSGYFVDTAFLVCVAVGVFHLTRARQMVRQYPWDYRRAFFFGFRSRH